MLVRYNKDFETVVRVDPIAVKRKDEFLTDAMEKVEGFAQKDVVNSYSKLKDRLRSFQDKLNNMNWERRTKSIECFRSKSVYAEPTFTAFKVWFSEKN